MPEFISNIDEANHRVNALETQLKLPKSEFIDNLDAANARIAELEAKAGKPATPPAPKASEELAKLKARHFELCELLGTSPQFQATCNTVAEYKTQITVLEARLKSRGEPQRPEVVAPKKPYNATLAFYKTGKATGIHKAMGAAIEKSEKSQAATKR